MILLLVALLLLPTAMLPKEEFFPTEKVEIEARDASFPAGARRALVVTRTGGVSPIKTLNVKIYEREGEFEIARVEYIIVYHNRDYIFAQRQVPYEAFERLWLTVNQNRALYLPSLPPGGADQPTYIFRIKDVKKENTITVPSPATADDERYKNIIGAIEKFWRDQLQIL